MQECTHVQTPATLSAETDSPDCDSSEPNLVDIFEGYTIMLQTGSSGSHGICVILKKNDTGKMYAAKVCAQPPLRHGGAAGTGGCVKRALALPEVVLILAVCYIQSNCRHSLARVAPALTYGVPAGRAFLSQVPFYEEAVSAVVQEAYILGQLSHPHVIELKDVVIVDKRLIVITEYAEHGDLLQMCKKAHMGYFSAGFNERLAMHVLFQMADALSYVHCNLIAHRDVKPANIVVSANAIFKVSGTQSGSVRRCDRKSSCV
eukprot:8060440-Pyramimonas_sp.AAC.2